MSDSHPDLIDPVVPLPTTGEPQQSVLLLLPASVGTVRPHVRPHSFKVEVQTETSGPDDWRSSQVRLSTEGEAEVYGAELSCWMRIKRWQILGTYDPVNFDPFEGERARRQRRAQTRVD